jgi:hypothetical protein
MKRIQNLKLITVIMLAFSLVFANTLQVLAYSIGKTETQKYTTLYTLKNLPVNSVVQNLFVTGDSVYVTQRKVNSGNADDTYLSRCVIQGNEAVYADGMVLEGFGHGATLDKYSYNNGVYFLVSYTPKDEAPKLARIQYTPGEHLTTSSKFPRFTYMNCANKSGSDLGTLEKATGIYTSTNKFVFRVQNTNKDITYTVYDGIALNQLLDNGNVQLRSSGAKNACSSSFTQSGSDRVVPYNVFQGMDVRQKGDIYVSGNSTNEKLNGKPKISKISTSGVCTIETTLSNCANIDEIEGLQISGQRIYFVLHTRDTEHTNNKANTQRVCFIDLF